MFHTAGCAGLRDVGPVLVEVALGSVERERRDQGVDHTEWLFGEVTRVDRIDLAR